MEPSAIEAFLPGGSLTSSTTNVSSPFRLLRHQLSIPYTPESSNGDDQHYPQRRVIPTKHQPLIKYIGAFPARIPTIDEHGVLYCDHVDCRNAKPTFKRRCEWNKHMDKHERPYKCREADCEESLGFTYSGGLLRHQREVHKMHLPNQQPLFCPFPNCKRSSGTGFTRKENLEEHKRRRHWGDIGDDSSSSETSSLDQWDSHTIPVKKDKRSDYRPPNRRGRGTRKNDAYWKDKTGVDEKVHSTPATHGALFSTLTDNEKDLFDDRECLFPDRNGRLVVPALANLDTQLKVPNGLVMSSRYAKEIGLEKDISTDFEDPCLRSISGHITPVTGIIRDVHFRLRGTSITFYRDFWICDALDSVVDIMLGASFIAENFKHLFDRFKNLCSTFAGWFSTRKETPEEKTRREQHERQQKLDAIKRERARLDREQAVLEAAQRHQQVR